MLKAEWVLNKVNFYSSSAETVYFRSEERLTFLSSVLQKNMEDIVGQKVAAVIFLCKKGPFFPLKCTLVGILERDSRVYLSPQVNILVQTVTG